MAVVVLGPRGSWQGWSRGSAGRLPGGEGRRGDQGPILQSLGATGQALRLFINDGKQWEDLNDRLRFAFFSFSVSYGEEIEADRLA